MDEKGFFWVFALLILMFGLGGNGFMGNRGPAPIPPDVATQEQVSNGFMTQQLQQIANATQQSTYETSRLINEQTNFLMQQNNTNQINAIQGFNQVQLAIQNQTNVMTQQMQAMQAKLDTCCCEIKTQMLQNRLDDANAKIVEQAGQISNLQQSQFLLGQMGRWVGWAGSGSQAATAAA